MATSTFYLLKFIEDLYKNKKYLGNDAITNYYICQKVCRNLLKKTKVNIEVNGLENIPNDNLLITANHQNFFDIIVLISLINKPIPFAAAKELMKYPILKDYIEKIGCVLIDRDTKDVKVMKKQLDDIENKVINNGLILFPEGECSYKDDTVKEFKKGGFIAANKNDVNIVPTYINYNGLKNMGKWYVPTGDIVVNFMKSFKSSDYGKISPSSLANITRDKVLSLKM